MSIFNTILSTKIKLIYNSIKYELFFNNEENEDKKRKKYILNILCLSMISFFSILLVLSIYSNHKFNVPCVNTSNMILVLFILASVLSFLFSIRGYILYGNLLILVLLYSCVVYGSLNWGADLPTVLIALFIMVLMFGILINSKYGLLSALFFSIHLWLFNYLEVTKFININYNWKKESFNQIDVAEYSFLLIFAALFSWLSNSQLEKSLDRSRNAEIKLKEERDTLEIKVGERTEEIKILQIEKINSLYRLVEFGRISSGLFHDIMSPLTNITLNLQLLKINEVKESMHYLIPSIKKIDSIIQQSKKHMRIDDIPTTFDVIEEIESVTEILKSKSTKNSVRLIILVKRQRIKINNSQTLFSHIIMNLISNAIDSHDQKFNNETYINLNKKVIILIKILENNLCIKIIDNGHGIKKEILNNIFEPFYTTKQEHGCGIGLSATKHILEKYFNGKINVKTKIQKGTTFTVFIPNIIIENYSSLLSQTPASIEDSPSGEISK